MMLFLSVWVGASSGIVLGLAICTTHRARNSGNKLERSSPMLGNVIIGLVVGLIAALAVSL